MWIYFYISEKRIAQLAYQINPSIPEEQVKRWEIKGSGKGNIKLNTSKLFQLVGISSEASADAGGSATRASENKFRTSDELIVDTVCKYLTEKENYTFLTPESSRKVLKDIRTLVRFRGHFKPLITGSNAADRLANYEELKSFNWKGNCGQVSVRFTTTKESIVSHTPIVQCLSIGTGVLMAEGFGTLSQREGDDIVHLLPLFLGLDTSTEPW